jgi:hypothetical protein
MAWISLGTYTPDLEGDPELYDADGRWIELLRDPPAARPYANVEVSAELAPGEPYWYVTEDLTDLVVSRLHVTAEGCRPEPWLRVAKGMLAAGRQAEKVREAFASADERPESAPRFLRIRLCRATAA